MMLTAEMVYPILKAINARIEYLEDDVMVREERTMSIDETDIVDEALNQLNIDVHDKEYDRLQKEAGNMLSMARKDMMQPLVDDIKSIVKYKKIE